MHKMNHASVAHKITVFNEQNQQNMNLKTNGITENSLRILDLWRTPETDSTNPWGSIEPRLRTTGLGKRIYVSICIHISDTPARGNNLWPGQWLCLRPGVYVICGTV